MEVDPNQSYSCPNGQTVTVKDLVNIYGDAVKQPIPTSGVLSTIPGSSKLNLKVSYSSRDVSVLERSSFAKIYTLDVGDGSNIQVESPTFPLDNSSMSAEVVSPSGKLRAALRSANGDQYFDIWNSRSKIQVINLSSLDAHGEIETGFGNLSFSPDESSLLYVAEAKRPRTESFFKNNLNGDSTPKLYGSEYLYKQDWGEGSPGVIHTVACVLRLADLKITVIDVPNYSASECFWITSAKVGFLGWKEFPKRIGLVYTANRPTKVFAAEVESNNVTELSSRDNLSVRCPRVSPSGSFLIWLENAAHGPHNCASQLILFDIATNQRQVVIDFEVKKEQVNPNDVTLKALFIDPLPDQCWSQDETTVFFQSDTCNRQVLWSLNLERKVLTQVTFPLAYVELLDIKNDVLVACGHSFNTKPSVHVAKFDTVMKWTRVEDASGDVIDGISFRKDTIPSGDDARPAFAFLLSPEAVKDTSAPVIVTPHGGPHGTIVECFMRNAALYVRLGFKLLLVDYRGSTGVDDDYVRSLLGEVGNLDVKDTVAAIHYYAGLNLIDRSKIILNGGSHGGFIVTHLAGQYPELNFVVCIARNPIIDYSTMTELTDEVDWVWNCTVKGQKWAYNANPNGEQLKQMYEKSPIAFVDKVRTPTLMMLGSRDRRVPMSQGIKWYNTLRANGVETRCHVYEDSHGLGQVKVDGDVFMNSMLWILSHLNQ